MHLEPTDFYWEAKGSHELILLLHFMAALSLAFFGRRPFYELSMGHPTIGDRFHHHFFRTKLAHSLIRCLSRSLINTRALAVVGLQTHFFKWHGETAEQVQDMVDTHCPALSLRDIADPSFAVLVCASAA